MACKERFVRNLGGLYISCVKTGMEVKPKAKQPEKDRGVRLSHSTLRRESRSHGEGDNCNM